ncbi:MAG: hypothetical protein IKG52_11265 [Rhodobacteraceae bacterium]|nr:hypothetical protein [Paracoccaceae bacterium]
MSDGFDDMAIERDAQALVQKARTSSDFAAAVFLAAARMLAATGNRKEIASSLRLFSEEVWTAASDTPDAIADADAFLARIRCTEGDPNA